MSGNARCRLRVVVLLVVTSAEGVLGQRPVISPEGLVNAASLSADPGRGAVVVPGRLLTLFGQALAETAEAAKQVPLPTTLAGVTVTVDGVPAPLLYVSPGQINFQVPFGTSARVVPVVVTTAKGASDPIATEPGSDPITIALRKGAAGAAISVQIEDIDGALARHEDRTAGAHLLVGVGGDDLLFRPAPLATAGGATRLYRVLVPFDTSIKLVVGSTLFRLADESGAPIESITKVMPVRVATGQVLPPVRLLVTGTRIP